MKPNPNHFYRTSRWSPQPKPFSWLFIILNWVLKTSNFIIIHIWAFSKYGPYIGLSQKRRVGFLKILTLNNSDYLVYLSCSWKDPFSAFVLKEMEIMKNSKKKQCFRPYGEQSATLRKSINLINPCAPLCSIVAPQC